MCVCVYMYSIQLEKYIYIYIYSIQLEKYIYIYIVYNWRNSMRVHVYMSCHRHVGM